MNVVRFQYRKYDYRSSNNGMRNGISVALGKPQYLRLNYCFLLKACYCQYYRVSHYFCITYFVTSHPFLPCPNLSLPMPSPDSECSLGRFPSVFWLCPPSCSVRKLPFNVVVYFRCIKCSFLSPFFRRWTFLFYLPASCVLTSLPSL